MKRNLFALSMIILTLTGCGGPYYYNLNLAPDPSEIKIDKILLVDDLNSTQAYWSQRMVFRRDLYKVEYFTFKQWAESLGKLIQNAVIKFYRNTSSFTRVIDEYSATEPALMAAKVSLILKEELIKAVQKLKK